MGRLECGCLKEKIKKRLTRDKVFEKYRKKAKETLRSKE